MLKHQWVLEVNFNFFEIPWHGWSFNSIRSGSLLITFKIPAAYSSEGLCPTEDKINISLCGSHLPAAGMYGGLYRVLSSYFRLKTCYWSKFIVILQSWMTSDGPHGRLDISGFTQAIYFVRSFMHTQPFDICTYNFCWPYPKIKGKLRLNTWSLVKTSP